MGPVNPPAAEQKLWREYGLEEASQASYEIGNTKHTANAYRLHDPTAALAAYQWQRPGDARPSDPGKLSVQAGPDTLVARGNYLLRFQGWKPEPAHLDQLFQSLPKLDQSSLPALSANLPAENLIGNSERYVTGPAALETFNPAIPASAAGFHFGAEAQLGTYRTPNGEMKLAIFSYPTPNIARERLAELQKVPGAVAKRSGPLVAVVVSPPNADDAERLLAQIRYQASISWSQYVPSRRDNIGDLITNVFTLIGVLLAFSTVAGLAFGGMRALSRRGGKADSDAMTVLRLGDR